jgi:biopolymer transport protein ExbD
MMTHLEQQIAQLEYTRFKHRKTGKRRHKYFEETANERELNLVAMMDMLTILLVFLLKSYSVSALSLPVGEDKMSIPISRTEINPREVVKVLVNRVGTEGSVIAVDDEEVLVLDATTITKLKTNSARRNYLIPELKQALLEKAEQQKNMAKLNPEIVFDHKVMIIADKKTPYWLVTSVLFSSAEAGYDQYNLVAIRRNQ